ncbi:MAG: putative metallopeptidase [Candidatus Aenigmarchaeota archaeon]|nr:putative metallopeptidase [Candidatus Aenigmarchaeota archaeon]
MINYERAPDIDKRAREIIAKLGMEHIDLSRVWFMRSRGSQSRYTLARIHVLPRIMQKALGIPTQYVIEVITEKFDRLPYDDQTKTIIHELMHIPESFGGGFRHHRPFVNKKTVEEMHRKYTGRKRLFDF